VEDSRAAQTEQSVAVAVWGNLGPTVVRMEEPIHPLHVNLRTGTVMSLPARQPVDCSRPSNQAGHGLIAELAQGDQAEVAIKPEVLP